MSPHAPQSSSPSRPSPLPSGSHTSQSPSPWGLLPPRAPTLPVPLRWVLTLPGSARLPPGAQKPRSRALRPRPAPPRPPSASWRRWAGRVAHAVRRAERSPHCLLRWGASSAQPVSVSPAPAPAPPRPGPEPACSGPSRAATPPDRGAQRAQSPAPSAPEAGGARLRGRWREPRRH